MAYPQLSGYRKCAPIPIQHPPGEFRAVRMPERPATENKKNSSVRPASSTVAGSPLIKGSPSSANVITCRPNVLTFFFILRLSPPLSYTHRHYIFLIFLRKCCAPRIIFRKNNFGGGFLKVVPPTKILNFFLLSTANLVQLSAGRPSSATGILAAPYMMALMVQNRTPP